MCACTCAIFTILPFSGRFWKSVYPTEDLQYLQHVIDDVTKNVFPGIATSLSHVLDLFASIIFLFF